MTHWGRFRMMLATILAGLVCLGIACGRGSVPLPSPQVPVQVQSEASVPPYVSETLAYIRQHGDAPPGFVGGRVFGNYEGALPRFNARRKRIAYREWDVHPWAEGRNRGTERLITGNDGRAWFTADHYRTFVEVK